MYKVVERGFALDEAQSCRVIFGKAHFAPNVTIVSLKEPTLHMIAEARTCTEICLSSVGYINPTTSDREKKNLEPSRGLKEMDI